MKCVMCVIIMIMCDRNDKILLLLNDNVLMKY